MIFSKGRGYEARLGRFLVVHHFARCWCRKQTPILLTYCLRLEHLLLVRDMR